MSEKIPKAMAEKFAAITSLTDAFCTKHLNEEYRQVIHEVVGVLARKRPSPLLRGKENVWAAAAVHAVGRVNFLDDSSQTPHCKPKAIYEFFGIGESAGQNKSKEIRDPYLRRTVEDAAGVFHGNAPLAGGIALTMPRHNGERQCGPGACVVRARHAAWKVETQCSSNHFSDAAGVTRHTTLPTSSSTSNAPCLSSATPTGRP